MRITIKKIKKVTKSFIINNYIIVFHHLIQYRQKLKIQLNCVANVQVRKIIAFNLNKIQITFASTV